MENVLHTTTQNRLDGRDSGLIGLMHSPYLGDHPATRQDLSLVPTPLPQGPRHQPVPYAEYVDLVTDSLRTVGLTVNDEAYALTKDNNRFFGLMNLRPSHIDAKAYAENPGVFALSVGLRGSHDQSIVRGLVAGSNVFVCSNLCFSGEAKIQTKHTTHIMDRLPGLIMDAVQTLPGVFEVQDQRYGKWAQTPMKPRWGDAALIELTRRGVMLPTQLMRAIKLWDDPPFPEYLDPRNTGTETRSAWTLAQAVTQAQQPHLDVETGRPTSLALPHALTRTQALTGFLDEMAGFDPRQAAADAIRTVTPV